MIDVAERTVVDTLETYDVDRNKAFFKAALKSVLNELVVFILDDSSEIRESFNDAIIQVTTVPNSLAIIAPAVAKDTAAMRPIDRFAAKILKQELEKSVKDLAFIPPRPTVGFGFIFRRGS